jgi:hypothetical protein
MKEFLMLVTALVVWYANSRSAAAKKRANPPARPAAPEGEDENVRQAREEVRRRIAARRGEGLRPAASAEAPASRAPVPAPPPRLVVPQASEPEVSVFAIEEEGKMRATQQKLEDQIKALEKESAAVNRPVPPVPTLTPIGGTGSPALAQLRDIPDLRRAVIWREILDKPVGLRGGAR